ncbi:C-C motif chemokine 24 [Nycticebus coucang]|uniref:C-C motif chemokine 24 n=1 Tax=Nycticebus coucang TaxID=9470 RepID=UPI00234DECE0|nr:C-C motif chemokine 24 [Nycticebus coucang]XP_053412677.1 C-C motif chemokine 24 [Nycticebus coucang]
MAGPVSIVTGLLLLALCTHHLTPTGSIVIPSSCCMSFISKKIPKNVVVSYQLSSGSVCPKAGVIFTTKKGMKVCGDPKQQWVQTYVKNLDAKQKKASVGAREASAKVWRRPDDNITI